MRILQNLLLAVGSVLVALRPIYGQLVLQCPTEKATVLDGGIIEFGPLSEITPVEASYAEPALSNWYAMANGFINGIGTQFLPYEEAIIPLINKTLIQPTTRIEVTPGEPIVLPVTINELFNLFSSWLTPTIVVTALGTVFALALVITGFVFFCCRFHGKCGGGDIDAMKNTESNACGMCVSVNLLLLVSIALFATFILLFLSGTQSSAASVHETFLEVVDDLGEYTSESVQQLYEIFCQLLFDGGVGSAIFEEFDDFDDELADTAVEVFTEVFTNHPDLEIRIDQTEEIGRNFSRSTLTLFDTLADLTLTLGSISRNLGTLTGNCALTFSPTAVGLCTDVVDPITNLLDSALMEITDIDLPSIQPLIDEIVNVLESVAQTVSAEGRDVVNSLISDVTEQINSTITDVFSAFDEYDESFGPLITQVLEIRRLANNILAILPERCPAVDGLEAFNSIGLPNLNINLEQGPGENTVVEVDADLFDLTKGYVTECLINAVFTGYILPFEAYRIALVVVISLLTLVPLIFILCGCPCGCIGFKGNRPPSDRSTCSNIGGNCLLTSAFCGFVLGALVLGASALVFLVGSNSLKLCRSLEEPQYELLAQTIDNPEVRESIRAVTDTTVLDIDNIPSVSQLLRDCKDNNTALYTALNLGSLLHLPTGTIGGTIRSLLNITTIQARVDSFFEFAIDTLDIDARSIERILSRAVNQTYRIDLTKLNLTDFALETEQALSRINFNDTIEELRNVSIQLQEIDENDPAEDIDDIIVKLEHVRDILPVLTSEFRSLVEQVNGFGVVQEELMRNFITIIVSFAEELDRLSEPIFQGFLNTTLRGAIYRSFGYIDQYIDHIENQVVNTVGGCQPLYGMLTKVHNSVCRSYLDGVNGFWWSLGFSSLLYVLLIIFAIISAQFFVRRRVDRKTEKEDLYPMKVLSKV